MTKQPSKSEVADIIESFILGSRDAWDWDDFISCQLHDSALDKIRQECRDLPEKYPPGNKSHYCSPKGIEVLRRIVINLRK